jgi:hypothetical protein
LIENYYFQAMKNLLLLTLFFFAFGAFAQKIRKVEVVSDRSIQVTGSNFEGIIFSKDYVPTFILYPPDTKKINLSIQDIIQVEQLIKYDVSNKNNQKIKDTFICQNLNKYLRQYIGYLNPKGQRIVFINFFWKNEIVREERNHKVLPKLFPEPQWKRTWFTVFDGGHFYWQIKINLSTMQLFEFGENGLA